MLEKIFHLKEKGTDIKQEFIAALVVFLSMLYIIPVSSEILSAAGMPKDALATSVILITILSTLAVGIYANTPVAMSVGMGLNAYFAYGLVLGSGIAWQSALGMVFLSGVVFLILSFSRFRVWILKSIPYDLKVALCVGLGAFLATIGFKGSGFFVINNGILLLGDLGQTPTLLATLGVLLILALSALKFKAAFILGIAVISIIGFICGIANTPEAFISLPASISPIFLELDIIGALQIAFLPAILTLMITDLF
ncbi:MAG: NCS2 family permease, partial [Helicobacter sp.]|nr:NCS2 family permease [Helicobacter sp.]